MINMMTVDEYAAATDEIRKLQSQLAESELRALKDMIDPYARIRLEKLRRRAALDNRMGPDRLKAATAESAAYDRRQNEAKKAQHDRNAKQRKDDTTQNPPHASSSSAAPAARKAGQKALSCSVTRIHPVSDSQPVRTAHSASA